MLKPLSLILFALVSATPSIAAQVKYQMSCDLGKGTTQTQRANSSTVILRPSNGMCRVSVLDDRGKSVFDYGATGMQVFVGVGVTTDGNANAIIQADTFNPYKLFIVSLGKHPHLVRALENQYGFWLQDDCGGRIRIWTSDGAFQKDPDLADVYHSDLFTPEVVFELQEEELVDATSECRVYFDKQIESLRSGLTEEDANRFRTNRIADDFENPPFHLSSMKIIRDSICAKSVSVFFS